MNFLFTCFVPGNSQLLNKGKMHIASLPGSEATLFINSNFIAIEDSEIAQDGKIVLKNDFINNVSSNNVIIPLSNGVFEFRGDKVQYIRGNADKGQSYIDFPHLIINNQTKVRNEKTDTSAVIIATEMGVNASTLTLQRGRLILESDTTGIGKSSIAHLLVEDDVNYPSDNEIRSLEDKSVIQVNLGLGKNYERGGLIGFTPPFGKIYADYFFYNFISTPANTDVFSNVSLMNNPKDALISGRGYILGLGLVPEGNSYYTEHLDPRWSSAKFSDRVTERLSLARDFAPRSITQFVNNDGKITDAFSGEKIITEDVSIRLTEGWNYVGNPYTAPLDMTTFINPGLYVDDWGVTRGGENAMVLSKYYLLTGGTGSYVNNGPTGKFIFNSSFQVIQKEAQTGDPDPFIAPMQMFVIWKNTNTPGGNLVIPKSRRKHNKTPYFRSSENVPTDEILIETKDIQTGGFDRICLAFRDNSSLKSNDLYDAEKIFNNTGGVNQIYTLSSDNKKMTSNVIPATTGQINLYFQPSSVQQQVVLRADRLESFAGGINVSLEDKKTGSTTDLHNNPEYIFTSVPTDDPDRFVLHFTDLRVGVEEWKEESDIQIYYSEGKLSVSGLKSDDKGRMITVYDISGKVISSRKLSQIPVYTLDMQFSKGIYVIHINRKGPVVRKIHVQ